jgi:adenylate cyclase
VDPSRDGGGGLTATGVLCGSCGTELPPNSKFCNECGTPLAQATRPAEYKQVTVLFADVVHSMDLAAAVGAERLREIMADLADRCAAVVKRYGGTVDKFTGDGIMAVFGAPVALEDHAVRACVAALGVQDEAKLIAVTVRERDGVDLQLRVGLNSGQVIAGEIGSGPFGYTAVGEQVGLAQRMESVAPPGGVILSASTARLVDGAAVLGEPELVRIKGADEGVPACRLLGMREDRTVRRVESNLVGRRWEMVAAEALLDRAIEGHGGGLGVVGSPGIGKSRLVREVTVKAAARGVEVFSAFCESHTTQIPFHAVARLLRAATEVEGLDAHAARTHIRERNRDADPEDLLLFDDLLGIADPDIALPNIDPDARRRRLTALVNTSALARESPAVYVIEDAHWIDEVSESMIAEFLTVIPQTLSLVLVTYRPEYQGALSRVAGAKTIALAPLSDPETAALVSQLLGPDPSVGALATVIAERAAGNPFFAEEMVRDLAERAVLRGNRSTYVSTVDAAEVSVPATLQATIAARIDRLNPKAKRTLCAAAVIGSKFSRGLLETVGIDPVLNVLVGGELIDQVTFTGDPAYVFHHPLMRMVAYESQLKSDRAELHRRLAAAIEARDPASVDENAALIAEHLEAAGDLHAAYGWHMRAGAWSTNRDITAARMSWQRARQVADRLPEDDRARVAMRIAPRALLCGSAWRAGGSVADTGFDELRNLCTVAGDKRSLAIGMAGLLMALSVHAHYPESPLASEFMELVESIGDPVLTIGLSFAPLFANSEVGDMAEVLRLAERVIELADGDATKGNLIFGSPLAFAHAMRGCALLSLGNPGGQNDFARAIAMGRAFDKNCFIFAVVYKYCPAMIAGVVPDAAALKETAEALETAEQSADDFYVNLARFARGVVLAHHEGPEHASGLRLLEQVREAAMGERFSMTAVPIVDLYRAIEHSRFGDVDGAIELTRAVIDKQVESGAMLWRGFAINALVKLLLARGTDGDVTEAEAALAEFTVALAEGGPLLSEIWLLRLRALLARARGDEATYRDYGDRYGALVKSLGFEGRLKWAEAMP